MEIPITIRQATLSDLEEMLAIEEANPSSELTKKGALNYA